MTGKAKTGKELEQRVANAYRQMGAKKVEHDVELAGNQIDVYVELEMADRSLHRIVVEAKDWTSRVGINIVNSFAHIVDLLRRERLIEEGIIVSATGFSRPARNAAQTYSIRLLELADLDAMVAKAIRLTPPTAPPISLPPTLYDEHPQRETQDQATGPRAVAPQPKGHQMIVGFSNEILAQYKVYSLCCHKLLDSCEELSEVCDIDILVGEFDAELRNSYCVDKYGLAVETVGESLQKLINQYDSNTDAREKLIAIRRAILDGALDWDFPPTLIEFMEIGKGLAQDFYCGGGRAPNIELIDSEAPALVFSNPCLSEDRPSCIFTEAWPSEPQPITFLSDQIYLPFSED
jgi:cytochrome c551/c552